MKKTNIIIVILAGITLGLSMVGKAQIYSNDITFYANTENSNDMYTVKFSGTEMRLIGDSRSKVRSNLSDSQSYYDKYDWSRCQKKIYCYDISTSSREVYKGSRMVQKFGVIGYTEGEGWKYFAFSKDKSSLIVWEEIPNNYDETIKKTYYTRVSKEDLLPKAVNRDFLND